jgi:hypothetical protein
MNATIHSVIQVREYLYAVFLCRIGRYIRLLLYNISDVDNHLRCSKINYGTWNKLRKSMTP